MAKFQPGNPGRPKGSRNRLHKDILDAYAEDFTTHGKDVITVLRVEKPVEWLRLAIQLLPKELLVEDISTVQQLDDTELDALIESLRTKHAEGKKLELMKTAEDLALDALENEKQRRLKENKLQYYHPYPKQREFHQAGTKYRERLLLAANQVGKTFAGAMEVAIHATGRYDSEWNGYRFDHPVRIWVCGESSEVVRETIQRLLLGEPGYHGTGTIPKDALLEVVPARGTPELVDTIRVRHASGGSSTIGLKSYSQGRERFQGATLDFAWCDEEPPSDVFHEILTRLNVTGGPLIMTFTPLMGMSEVVRRFLLEKSPHRTVIKMTWTTRSTTQTSNARRLSRSIPST